MRFISNFQSIVQLLGRLDQVHRHASNCSFTSSTKTLTVSSRNDWTALPIASCITILRSRYDSNPGKMAVTVNIGSLTSFSKRTLSSICISSHIVLSILGVGNPKCRAHSQTTLGWTRSKLLPNPHTKVDASQIKSLYFQKRLLLTSSLRPSNRVRASMTRQGMKRPPLQYTWRSDSHQRTSAGSKAFRRSLVVLFGIRGRRAWCLLWSATLLPSEFLHSTHQRSKRDSLVKAILPDSPGILSWALSMIAMLLPPFFTPHFPRLTQVLHFFGTLSVLVPLMFLTPIHAPSAASASGDLM